MKLFNKHFATPKLLDSAAGAARSICRKPLAIAAAAALPLAITSPTLAQDYDYDTEAYEYEPNEGWHEEEWYDPSDWFDDEPRDEYTNTYDYEDDDWGYDSDDDYYGNDYGYYNDYGWDYEGYYDGYYDGYFDDDYGYDYWDTDWNTEYQDSYTGGYSDGYYDQESDYDYEPDYYIYSTSGQDRSQNTARERQRDDTRQRGDRMRDRSGLSQMERQAQREREMTRKRGTIEGMSPANIEGIPSDHQVMRLRMDDGDTVVANFGPNMTRNRLPISSGDRVTLKGKKRSVDGREVLYVHSLFDGSETVTLRGSGQDQMQQDRRTQRDRRMQQNRRTQRDSQMQRDRRMQQDRRTQRDRQMQDRRTQQDRQTGQDGWTQLERRSGQDRQQDRQNVNWGYDMDRGGQNTVSMSGTLDRVQRLNRDVNGHAIYRVQIDGRQAQLAVKSDEADKLRMNRGDRIQLEGQRKMMNDRRVIDVKRIRGQSNSNGN